MWMNYDDFTRTKRTNAISQVNGIASEYVLSIQKFWSPYHRSYKLIPQINNFKNSVQFFFWQKILASAIWFFILYFRKMEKTTTKVTGGTENLFEANDDVKCILTIRKLFINYYNNTILFI